MAIRFNIMGFPNMILNDRALVNSNWETWGNQLFATTQFWKLRIVFQPRQGVIMPSNLQKAFDWDYQNYPVGFVHSYVQFPEGMLLWFDILHGGRNWWRPMTQLHPQKKTRPIAKAHGIVSYDDFLHAMSVVPVNFSGFPHIPSLEEQWMGPKPPKETVPVGKRDHQRAVHRCPPHRHIALI